MSIVGSLVKDAQAAGGAVARGVGDVAGGIGSLVGGTALAPSAPVAGPLVAPLQPMQPIAPMVAQAMRPAVPTMGMEAAGGTPYQAAIAKINARQAATGGGQLPALPMDNAPRVPAGSLDQKSYQQGIRDGHLATVHILATPSPIVGDINAATGLRP